MPWIQIFTTCCFYYNYFQSGVSLAYRSDITMEILISILYSVIRIQTTCKQRSLVDTFIYLKVHILCFMVLNDKPRKGQIYATERCITLFLEESSGVKLTGAIKLVESLKNVPILSQ